MTNKRYFKVEYDEEWYLFDSTTISEQLVKEQAEYGYGVFANSLSPSEICDRLNTLHQENHSLKFQLDECANNKLYSRRKLEEENEQLRQNNNELKNIINFTSRGDAELVILLMRDNIRLRQELQENRSYKTIEKGVDDGK